MYGPGVPRIIVPSSSNVPEVPTWQNPYSSCSLKTQEENSRWCHNSVNHSSESLLTWQLSVLCKARRCRRTTNRSSAHSKVLDRAVTHRRGTRIDAHRRELSRRHPATEPWRPAIGPLFAPDEMLAAPDLFHPRQLNWSFGRWPEISWGFNFGRQWEQAGILAWFIILIMRDAWESQYIIWIILMVERKWYKTVTKNGSQLSIFIVTYHQTIIYSLAILFFQSRLQLTNISLNLSYNIFQLNVKCTHSQNIQRFSCK